MSHALEQPDLVLLGRLLRAEGRPLQPEQLGHDTGATPRAVDRSLRTLAEHGCRFEQDLRGVRLIETGLGVWSDYLAHALPGPHRRSIEVYRRTGSTQDLVKARATEPLLIFADEQTGGRGRLGRRWHAPPGAGLLFSLTHRPPAGNPGSVDRVSFLTAVALTHAIEQLTGRGPIQISWPNDLVVEGRKLAGILVESVRATNDAPPTLIIGVGINVGLTSAQIATMPPDVRRRATSFAVEGWAADRLLVAEHVIAEIDRCLHAADVEPLVEAWRTRNLYRDQTIRLRADGRDITGTVLDLDPDTGLILRRDTGELIHLHAATTTVIP